MSNLSNQFAVLQEFSDALAGLVESNLPRTASIWVKARDLTSAGSGSGWCIDRTHIVTNHHVVSGAAEELRIRLPGQFEKTGRIIGSDSQTDLAVIEVDDVGVDPFKVRLTPELRRGELCLTMGTPLGEFNESVALGVVSGLSRQIIMGETKFEEAIQIDATINPGNSGGPLIDMGGNVVGVNFCSRGDAAQLNFAIPSEVVVDIVPELLAFGSIARAGIGVSISSTTVAVDGMPTRAVEVLRTKNPASPLRSGDVIVSINGTTISRRYDLIRKLDRSTIGASVQLMVYRDNSILELDVMTETR